MHSYSWIILAFTVALVGQCAAGPHLVRDYNDFTFQLNQAESKLVVTFFFAYWSGPSKMIAPKIEVMSNEITDVVFLKVEVDDNDDIATEYDVSILPQFIFLKSGKIIARYTGIDQNRILELIQEYK